MSNENIPFEPGMSYKDAIAWLSSKAKTLSTISPAISGAYLALAGELSEVRESAIERYNERAKKVEPPHDPESQA